MAKRPSSNSTDQITAKLIFDKDDFSRQIQQRIDHAVELISTVITDLKQFEKIKSEFYSWDDYNSELLKQAFNVQNNEYKQSYDDAGTFLGLYSGPQTPDEEITEFKERAAEKIQNLINLKNKIALIKSDIEKPAVSIVEKSKEKEVSSKDIFIVHGHNDTIKINVARTLEKLDINAIILNEKPNSGKTIIEKFEKYSNVGFAIILLTKDDFGKDKTDENLMGRARQNVILELGYFIGKLGRSRVCPLYELGVELPSDLHGLVYVELDKNEAWKMKLAKELRAAGYNVDANKLI